MSEYAVIMAARMGSSRLPGKAVANYGAGANLALMLDRWRASDRSPVVIFTTTELPEDDPLAQMAAQHGFPVSRGDPRNVVAQMDQAVRRHAPEARWIARALADNPLVDIALADWRLDVLVETGAEGLWYGGDEARLTYAATTDVWSRTAWDRIAAGSSGSQLEHPGEYYWNQISRFNVIQLQLPRREYLAAIRTELDTDLDLAMLSAVWHEWALRAPGVRHISTLWALKLMASRPDLSAINGGVATKTQSRALFPKHFKPHLCPHCQQRLGSIIEGNLRTYCPGCGQPHTFYAHKPARRTFLPE